MEYPIPSALGMARYMYMYLNVFICKCDLIRVIAGSKNVAKDLCWSGSYNGSMFSLDIFIKKMVFSRSTKVHMYWFMRNWWQSWPSVWVYTYVCTSYM